MATNVACSGEIASGSIDSSSSVSVLGANLVDPEPPLVIPGIGCGLAHIGIEGCKQYKPGGSAPRLLNHVAGEENPPLGVDADPLAVVDCLG
ncbi:MAG: hypothetical protein J07HN6_00954 [Halonotius sp. J07HN6]|nr:MAG: hypothetical protein J07HN6_00954 [Halonotius sp. J07HN6]